MCPVFGCLAVVAGAFVVEAAVLVPVPMFAVSVVPAAALAVFASGVEVSAPEVVAVEPVPAVGVWVPVESELVGQSVRAVRVAVPVVVVPRLVVEVALAPVAVFVPLLPAPHRPLFVPPERRPAPYLPVVEDRPFNACAGSLTQ